MVAIPYEIPLTPAPQKFNITLAGITYRLVVSWNDAPTGGWVLDILDTDGGVIIGGIPLVTGANLLAQYAYKGFANVSLIVQTDSDLNAVPTFSNLGTQSHLYFIADDGT